MPFVFTSPGKCPKCGGESFTSPSNPSDYAPVTCAGCGHVTTVKNAIDTLKAANLGPQRFPKRER